MLCTLSILQIDSIRRRLTMTLEFSYFTSSSSDRGRRDLQEEETNGEEPSFQPMLLVIIIGVTILLVAIIVGVIITQRRKRARLAARNSIVSYRFGRPVDKNTLKVIRGKVTHTLFPVRVIVKSTDDDLQYYDPESNTTVKHSIMGNDTDSSASEESNERRSRASATTASVDEKICAICLEGYKVGDEIALTVGCEHVFHRRCILSWSQLKRECPVCRIEMWESKAFDKLEKDVADQVINSNNNTPV